MNPSTPPRILIVEDDPAISELMRLLLTRGGYQVIAVNSGEAAWEQVTRQPPDMAIVDVVLPGMDGYALCRNLRQNMATRTLPIVLLGSKGEVADKIAGFEAGADDYLLKPFDPQELSYRVKNLLARAQAVMVSPAKPAARGRIIAFFGPKGGVGKTTLAVNAAIVLYRRTGKRLVLFDADVFFGDLGLQLNMPPVRSILDLVKSFDDLDREFIEQVVVTHSSGVRVLLSPFQREHAELITAHHIKRLLDLLAELYDYVVVDCHATYDERTLVILEQANDIFLVVTPEIGPLINASMFLDLASKLSLDTRRIHVVLNRADSNVGIEAGEVERTLRQQIAFRVMSGGRQVVLSVNRGTPLVLQQPNHPFSQQIQKMVEFLVKK